MWKFEKKAPEKAKVLFFVVKKYRKRGGEEKIDKNKPGIALKCRVVM